MRITGGIHRSRKLETPKSDAVRPTSDKVRQAVFNMLNSRGVLQDAIVIDAFCGTGALGLEALSQGAAYCTFFDKDKNSIQLCKANISNLAEDARAKVMYQDATKLKQRPENIQSADLVFLDPPYNKELVLKAIQSLKENHWLASEVFFVIEVSKNENISYSDLEALNEKIYGDTKIILSEFKS